MGIANEGNDLEVPFDDMEKPAEISGELYYYILILFSCCRHESVSNT